LGDGLERLSFCYCCYFWEPPFKKALLQVVNIAERAGVTAPIIHVYCEDEEEKANPLKAADLTFSGVELVKVAELSVCDIAAFEALESWTALSNLRLDFKWPARSFKALEAVKKGVVELVENLPLLNRVCLEFTMFYRENDSWEDSDDEERIISSFIEPNYNPFDRPYGTVTEQYNFLWDDSNGCLKAYEIIWGDLNAHVRKDLIPEAEFSDEDSYDRRRRFAPEFEKNYLSIMESDELLKLYPNSNMFEELEKYKEELATRKEMRGF
jgi:hypothetical protein